MQVLLTLLTLDFGDKSIRNDQSRLICCHSTSFAAFCTMSNYQRQAKLDMLRRRPSCTNIHADNRFTSSEASPMVVRRFNFKQLKLNDCLQAQQKVSCFLINCIFVMLAHIRPIHSSRALVFQLLIIVVNQKGKQERGSSIVSVKLEANTSITRYHKLILFDGDFELITSWYLLAAL